MSTHTQTTQQQQKAEGFHKLFGIPKGEVFFPDPDRPLEPCLTTSALLEIARNIPDIRDVSEQFDRYEPALQQLVYRARVILSDGRAFERTGVARVNEPIPGKEKESDGHGLAGSRAVRKVLAAVGVDPIGRPEETKRMLQASPTPLQVETPPSKPVTTIEGEEPNTDAAWERYKDLQAIHALAERKGLITRESGHKDMGPYREWLEEFCIGLGKEEGIRTASRLNQTERAMVVKALEELPDCVGV